MTPSPLNADVSEMDKRLETAIRESVAAYNALSPIERAIHDLKQRRSGVRGLAKMSTPNEVIDAHLDKQPEYVLLKAYEVAISELASLRKENERLQTALKNETERCAGIVERAKPGALPFQWADRESQILGDGIAKLVNQLCDQIATALRSGKGE